MTQELLLGDRAAMFADREPAQVCPHAQPAWKIVLSPDRPATVAVGSEALEAHGFLVPSQTPHTGSTTSGHVTILIDSWHGGLGRRRTGVGALESSLVRRLLDIVRAVRAPGEVDDLALTIVELLRRHELIGPPVPIDPRLEHALASVSRFGSVEGVAAEVGLSPSHLRRLSREELGSPLVNVRAWLRLRRAVEALGHLPPAQAAAHAGFADQAHLTRTARRLLGRTPGTISPQVAAARS